MSLIHFHMNTNPEGAADQSNDQPINSPHEINREILELVNNMPGLSEKQRLFIIKKSFEQLQPKNLRKGDTLDWNCTYQDIMDAVRKSAQLVQIEDDNSDPIMKIQMPMRTANADSARKALGIEEDDDDLPATG